MGTVDAVVEIAAAGPGSRRKKVARGKGASPAATPGAPRMPVGASEGRRGRESGNWEVGTRN